MENLGEIIIYQTEDGLTKLEVKMENDTVWLTQAQLVELYQSSKANVSEHIAHIFEEGELVKEAVVRKFRTTASDGKNYNVLYYNLDSRKFQGDDFMFELTDEETEELSRCKNFTLNQKEGRGTNIKYNPHVFTEQGIYMLIQISSLPCNIPEAYITTDS